MHLWDIISTGLTAVGIGLELARIRRERKRGAEEAAASEVTQQSEPTAESDTRNGESADAEDEPEAQGT